jgi:glycerophosphoryl diester phosphodiesterase
MGVRFLETDVHATRDGVLVAHHDDTVDRTTDGSGRITDMRYAELATLDAGYRFTRDGTSHPYRGTGLTIPTLLSVFALSTRARLNVEIKPKGRDAVRLLWELIDAHGLYDRILVAAENDRQVKRFRRLSGGRVATSAGARETFGFFAASRLGMERLLTLPYDALQVPVRYKGVTIVDRALIHAAHRNGIQVHVWTIDEPSEMRRLLNLGADGIMSDYPDRLSSLAAAIAASKREGA